MSKFLRFSVHRICLIIVMLISTVGCDQITKAVARETLPMTGSISYFNNSVVLEYAENTGAFLSLGAGLNLNIRFLIFTIAVGCFLGFGLIFLFSKNNLDKYKVVAISLVLGGGIGNLIDRAFRGSVTDFIHMNFGPIQTGIFNIADVAIVAGVLLLVLNKSKESRLQS